MGHSTASLPLYQPQIVLPGEKEKLQAGAAIDCSQYSRTINSEAGTVPAAQMDVALLGVQRQLITALPPSTQLQSCSAKGTVPEAVSTHATSNVGIAAGVNSKENAKCRDREVTTMNKIVNDAYHAKRHQQ